MSRHQKSAFSEKERREMKKRHEAWKKARSSGKMKEYKAKQQAKKDKADAKTKKDLKAKHELWKTDRKKYNKQKRAHITKQETKRFDTTASKNEAWKKENKRGKYSKGHQKKQEQIYGKGVSRNLGRVKRFLSGGLLASKEAKADQKNKLKIQDKKRKRRGQTIASRVEAQMNR
jgi:hypothetical protein